MVKPLSGRSMYLLNDLNLNLAWSLQIIISDRRPQMGVLETKICNIPLENPFLLASAPPTASIELIEGAFEIGWAGVVTKTMKPDYMDIQDARPRFNVIKEGSRVIGLENFELVSKKPLSYWKEGIAYLKKKWPTKVIIASIMGDSTRESWVSLAREMDSSEADGIELNFSCPHGMPEKGGGAAIGQNPEYTKMITAWVKETTSLPVIVKLTPNVTSVVDQARAAVEGGADGFAAINTVQSLSGVDLDRLEPLPSVNGMSTYGGLSGKAVKPIGLRVVAEVCSEFDLPMMGIGGISDWKDAMEYMAVGSCCVQVCTEVMIKGFAIVQPMIRGSRAYMEKMNFTHVNQLIGKALPKLTSHEVLEKERPVDLVVDHEKCIGCGLCVTACKDGGYQAISLIDEKARIDKKLCDGCSLCTHICPKDALTLILEEKKAV
jgi:dihydropyrimidine dehydrogenase (NAD+) subunit PreA